MENFELSQSHGPLAWPQQGRDPEVVYTNALIMASWIVAPMDALIGTGSASALSWAVTDPAAQGTVGECSGDFAIPFPDAQSCLDQSVPAAGPLGAQGQG